MSDPSKDSKEPEVYRIKRFQIASNVLLQIILIAAVVVMANYSAFKFYKRWDFSTDSKFTLSEQTSEIVKGLRGQLQFIVFVTPDSAVYGPLTSLLKEYQYTGGDHVSVEFIDPYRNFNRARDLQGKYKFGAEENIVIVDYNGRHKFVNELDMAELDESGMAFGQPATLAAFKGEQALTSAIIEVSKDKKGQLYFLRGLGQPTLDEGTEISALIQFIERQYLSVTGLNIGEIDTIPEDADAVMIAGPKYDVSERELKVIEEYWRKQGRIILLLDPTALTPKLTSFVQSLGVVPNDDRVLRTVNLGPVTGILREVSALFVSGTPSTKGLENIRTLFLGDTQSLSRDTEATQGLNIEVKPLIEAEEGFWGETNYQALEGDPVIFEPTKDTAPPIILATSVEQGGVKDDRVQVSSSRMVVVGNSSFITDDTLTEANLDFLLNSLNWLIDREDMIGIAPKEIKRFTLNLSEPQVTTLAMLCMVAIPATAAFLGVLVYLRRRS